MVMTMERILKLTGFFVLMLVPLHAVSVRNPKAQVQSKPTPPDIALDAYITQVRAQSAAEICTPGSIWIDSGRLARLNTDVKALHVHDPIAVVVSESLA